MLRPSLGREAIARRAKAGRRTRRWHLVRARGAVRTELLLDAAGRRRSPAGIPRGTSARNKGVRYPADPPAVEEIVAVMRAGGGGAHGRRLRGLIVVLWRAGLRMRRLR
jgi:hypothetical protein